MVLLTRSQAFVRSFAPRCRHQHKLSGEYRADIYRDDGSLCPPQAFSMKSNWELLRGWMVFKMFTYNSLVDNSSKLYQVSRRYLGRWVTEKLLRASVFGQFTGGLNEAETERVVRRLAGNGVSSIWYYADEKCVGEVAPPRTMEELKQAEQHYQQVNEKYLKSIEMSAACNCDTPSRMAAVKLTAIVNPTLLKKLSDMLLASDRTFLSLASPTATDHITVPTMARVSIPSLLQSAGLSRTGSIDIVDWRSFFSLPHNIESFELLRQLNSQDELSDIVLTDMEHEQLLSFVERLDAIGECSSSLGVRTLIDAEQNSVQHVIEHLTLYYMMKKYNCTHPVIYNTAQAYLTRLHRTLQIHLAAAQRMGVECAIKLVRGCYLEHETHLAKVHGYASPIHTSKEATDDSYNRALDFLLHQAQKGRVHLVVASHNRHSVERAQMKMKELHLSPRDGRVTFGQQLGMGDHLTYPLAQDGYIVNKVMAYGSLDNVVPFLVRRAQENRGFIRNAQEERFFYIDEIKRRLYSSNR